MKIIGENFCIVNSSNRYIRLDDLYCSTLIRVFYCVIICYFLHFRSREGKHGKKDPMSIRKKFLVVLVIGIIGFLTIIVIFSKLGRSGIDEDPFLGNPQVRVMDEIMD